MFNSFFSTKVIVGLVIVYAVFVAVAVYLSSPTNPVFKLEKFNKISWLKDTNAGEIDNQQDCARGKMAQDLIDKHLTKNLTKSDVVDLLGRAPSHGQHSLSQHSLEYPIGWCGYNFANSIYIEFNGDFVRKAYLITH